MFDFLAIKVLDKNIFNLRISPDSFMAYACLTLDANQENGEVTASSSYKSLANRIYGDESPKSITRTRKSVSELLNAQLISKQHLKNLIGGYTKNCYKFNPNSKWQVKNPKQSDNHAGSSPVNPGKKSKQSDNHRTVTPASSVKNAEQSDNHAGFSIVGSSKKSKQSDNHRIVSPASSVKNAEQSDNHEGFSPVSCDENTRQSSNHQIVSHFEVSENSLKPNSHQIVSHFDESDSDVLYRENGSETENGEQSDNHAGFSLVSCEENSQQSDNHRISSTANGNGNGFKPSNHQIVSLLGDIENILKPSNHRIVSHFEIDSDAEVQTEFINSQQSDNHAGLSVLADDENDLKPSSHQIVSHFESSNADAERVLEVLYQGLSIFEASKPCVAGVSAVLPRVCACANYYYFIKYLIININNNNISLKEKENNNNNNNLCDHKGSIYKSLYYKNISYINTRVYVREEDGQDISPPLAVIQKNSEANTRAEKAQEGEEEQPRGRESHEYNPESSVQETPNPPYPPGPLATPALKNSDIYVTEDNDMDAEWAENPAYQLFMAEKRRYDEQKRREEQERLEAMSPIAKTVFSFLPNQERVREALAFVEKYGEQGEETEASTATVAVYPPPYPETLPVEETSAEDVQEAQEAVEQQEEPKTYLDAKAQAQLVKVFNQYKPKHWPEIKRIPPHQRRAFECYINPINATLANHDELIGYVGLALQWCCGDDYWSVNPGGLHSLLYKDNFITWADKLQAIPAKSPLKGAKRHLNEPEYYYILENGLEDVLNGSSETNEDFDPDKFFYKNPDYIRWCCKRNMIGLVRHWMTDEQIAEFYQEQQREKQELDDYLKLLEERKAFWDGIIERRNKTVDLANDYLDIGTLHTPEISRKFMKEVDEFWNGEFKPYRDIKISNFNRGLIMEGFTTKTGNFEICPLMVIEKYKHLLDEDDEDDAEIF